MSSEATARLRRAAAAMRAGKPVPDEDALRLADAIDGALAGKVEFDVALGLASSSPLSRQALARRALLIERLSRHYNGSLSGRAKEMADDAQRYAIRVWPNLRGTEGPPQAHIGRCDEILFVLHSEAETGGARWPLVWRSIVEVLEPLQPIRWDCKLIASPTRRP